MSEPTQAEIATVAAETMRHILTVRSLLLGCILELAARADGHDRSKLEAPEDAMYAVFTARLATLTYGSEEYRACLREMGPALAHHYAHNSHHPEYHPDGIAGMNLFDLLEMLCDWKAATLRHRDGSLEASLRINETRFAMPPAIVRLLRNTISVIDALALFGKVAASYPHVEGEAHGGR